MSDWLVGIALAILALLLAAMFLVGRERPKETPAICAWCEHRSGDICYGEGSTVYQGVCEPVCAALLPCKVRQEECHVGTSEQKEPTPA